MAFNRLIACSALSDINTTLKIGITIKWSLKLRYVVVVASLWCWKEISYNNVISVSVRSRSVGLYRNENQTKNRCHHNIAWPLLYFKKKSVHVMITIIHALRKGRNAERFFFTFIQIVSVSMPHLVFIEWRYKATEKRCKVIDEWLRCMTVICVNCPILYHMKADLGIVYERRFFYFSNPRKTPREY